MEISQWCKNCQKNHKKGGKCCEKGWKFRNNIAEQIENLIKVICWKYREKILCQKCLNIVKILKKFIENSVKVVKNAWNVEPKHCLKIIENAAEVIKKSSKTKCYEKSLENFAKVMKKWWKCLQCCENSFHKNHSEREVMKILWNILKKLKIS